MIENRADPFALRYMTAVKSRYGSWLCKNAETRNGDRMKILRNRIRLRKDSPAHSVSLDWRKTILVASQFFAFSHSLGHERLICDDDATSAFPRRVQPVDATLYLRGKKMELGR